MFDVQYDSYAQRVSAVSVSMSVFATIVLQVRAVTESVECHVVVCTDGFPREGLTHVVRCGVGHKLNDTSPDMLQVSQDHGISILPIRYRQCFVRLDIDVVRTARVLDSAW